MPAVDHSVRDRNCIEHMLRYCKQLDSSLEEIQRSRERFLSSNTYQNAVAMCILQLGELTKQLSQDFISTHREIPWNLIARTRDIYAHHYGSIDVEMLWATAVGDIPALRAFCEGFLDS
ncbi:MAG: DUF86 domain-containing protein [Clostridia bacterium]|nr:DUF86 domain-containing protein [Clostridia bacterium]